jgi:hypothetical protein
MFMRMIWRKRPLLILIFALITTLGSGCDDSDGSKRSSGPDGLIADGSAAIDSGVSSDGRIASDAAVVADSGMQTGLPSMGEWRQISPGGDTICSRGTPFSFFVRGGRTDRIVVDFRGGGACWNDFTCSIAGSIFSEDVGDFEQLRTLIDSGLLGGIFDNSEDSLFKDWTIVHIPYCTGDIHWGNATHTYGDNNVIHHRGHVNASAALQWVYDHVAAPENVLVSGCSAGAYGAIMHSAYIANHYLDSKIAVLADSGAGIITDTFLNDSLPNWGAQQNIPPFIEGLQRPITEMKLPDLYEAIGAHFPQHRYAQTSTAFDSDQVFYYTAMGGNAADWPPRFQASISSIEESTPNFRAYIPAGPVHCVTPYPFFKTRMVNGVGLVDWLRDFIHGDEIPASQKCQGDDCFEDPVCDACAELGNIWCHFCDGWPDRFRPNEADGGVSTPDAGESTADAGSSAPDGGTSELTDGGAARLDGGM